jgi:hypothetical protein
MPLVAASAVLAAVTADAAVRVVFLLASAQSAFWAAVTPGSRVQADG